MLPNPISSGRQYRKKPGTVTTKYVKSGVPFKASRTAFWIFEPHGEQYQRHAGAAPTAPPTHRLHTAG